jgi:hypothetical protein
LVTAVSTPEGAVRALSGGERSADRQSEGVSMVSDIVSGLALLVLVFGRLVDILRKPEVLEQMLRQGSS